MGRDTQQGWCSQLPHPNRLMPLFVLLLGLLPSPAHAAFEYGVRSVNSCGMSEAVDLLDVSVIDIGSHPALRGEGKCQIDLSVTQLYNLQEFTLGSGVASVNLRSLTLNLGTTQLTGSDFYWERSYLAGISVGASSRVRLGLAGSYNLVQYDGGYPDLDFFSLSLGVLLMPSSNLRVAASAGHINRPRYYSGSERFPRTGSISMGYRFSKSLAFFSTYSLEEKVPDRLSMAQRLDLNERFSFRLGIQTNPLNISGGITVRFSKFCFDYAYTDSVYLGGTHRIGLRYCD